VYCSVLQCVAVFHSVLQPVAMDVFHMCVVAAEGDCLLQHVAIYCSVLQWVAMCVAVCCCGCLPYAHGDCGE